jgi:hypothetical protein
VRPSRGSECMAWRWAAHRKIENREPRPTGYCGMVAAPLAPLQLAGVEEIIAAEDGPPTPNAPSSIIQQ